ncbi:MAG: alpha/beta hydrolase [Blautia sp.]|nr:alpha/beta hydrolase [Blautia sp.]
MEKSGRFCLESSTNEILDAVGASPYLGFYFETMFLDLLNDELKAMPLAQVKDLVKMPWGDPFLAENLVDAGNTVYEIMENQAVLFFPLWEKESDSYVPESYDGDKGKVCLYINRDMLESDHRKPVIVCPGGGYNVCASMVEGFPVAEELFRRGYKPFILNYRVNPYAAYPNPQMDLMLAVKFLRLNADRFGIDPQDLLVVGFSAAGHLTGSEAGKAQELEEMLLRELSVKEPDLAKRYAGVSAIPDKICLSYPVITFTGPTHQDTAENNTGGDPKKRAELSIENMVKDSYPPTFLWVCEDDQTVPYTNTIAMKEALEKAGVRHQCFVYPQGDHGIAAGIGTSAEGWIDEMCSFFK